VVNHHGAPVWVGAGNWAGHGGDEDRKNVANGTRRAVTSEVCDCLFVDRAVVDEVIWVVSVLGV
jgi:hypothetical protein